MAPNFPPTRIKGARGTMVQGLAQEAAKFFLGHNRATTKIYFCRLQVRLDQNMTIRALKASLD